MGLDFLRDTSTNKLLTMVGRKGTKFYQTKEETALSVREYRYFMDLVSKAVSPGKSTRLKYLAESLTKLKEK